MRLAVDLDDTLYSFTQTAREVLVDLAIARGDETLMTLASASWSEWRTPAAMIGVENWFEIIERCHRPEVILDRQSYFGASDTLWDLVDAGHTLTYITSRDSQCEDATARWLQDNEFPFDPEGTATLMCQYFPSKAEHIADCQVIIDDRPHNLIEFVYDFAWQYQHGSENHEMQRFGLGLLSEYNRSLTDVDRIHLVPNWINLRHVLLEKGLLP